jgi:hypothetical protein
MSFLKRSAFFQARNDIGVVMSEGTSSEHDHVPYHAFLHCKKAMSAKLRGHRLLTLRDLCRLVQ